MKQAKLIRIGSTHRCITNDNIELYR